MSLDLPDLREIFRFAFSAKVSKLEAENIYDNEVQFG
jgi:hypothetical protein